MEKLNEEILGIETQEDRRSQNDTQQPISVSDYVNKINVDLKQCGARIIGEISEVNPWRGHFYITLKDKEEKGVLKCFLSSENYKVFGLEPEVGTEVVVSGHSRITRKGRLDFQILTIELVGEGKLRQAYKKLKKKLENEGLFAQEKKIRIPPYIKKIGLITSRSGDAIGDFTSNLGTFGFQVKLVDSRVGGQAAVKELLAAVRTLKKKDIDVLVITRGGGSFESLMVFNNELLVREIADFPKPVIAGIGHEKDVPLVCLAADLSVSTASIAARTLTEPWNKLVLWIQNKEETLSNKYGQWLFRTRGLFKEHQYELEKQFNEIIKHCKKQKEIFSNIVFKLESGLLQKRNLLNKTSQQIQGGFAVILNCYYSASQSLKNFLLRLGNALVFKDRELLKIQRQAQKDFARLLDALTIKIKNLSNVIRINDPERQLTLGYCLARTKTGILKSVVQTQKGEIINLTVSDGVVDSEVKKINKKK